MRRLRDLLILGLSPGWVRLEVIPMIGAHWIIGIQNAPSLIGNKNPPKRGVFYFQNMGGENGISIPMTNPKTRFPQPRFLDLRSESIADALGARRHFPGNA